MSKTIPQLRSMWNRGADSYRTQEVGSGVQGFVKDVLECSDTFNLKEGELSTPREERKNEFIYEKKTKERRRADFDIFIDSDIEIPIEVEQYTNIEQGEGQLFKYQSDLEKKYGILTDGYTWRFYNNTLYRSFTLDHLLSDTAYFLEFWKEYITLYPATAFNRSWSTQPSARSVSPSPIPAPADASGRDAVAVGW